MAQTTPELRPARKVLVIDDEEAFCVLMARMITNLGYKAITTNQAKSAHLDEMTESDIIFIDMMMPEMNGLQVLEVLSGHHIKSSIILMSGADNEVLASAETFAKRANLKLIGVLNKPFRLDDVRTILEAD
jgi:CheY-like chemotaxis protein